MPTTYRATLTNVGAALVADAIAQGTTLTWAKMALGDGNGSAVIVDAGRTSLVNERYRAPLNDLGRDSANPNTIVGTLVVPPETGGWTIREFGIYDNASTPRLVAYGETPEIEKPASAAGTGINLRLRFKLVVSADANITLSPDSNEAYATIEYVKDNAVKSLSVSGRTITYTMGDGDTHTIRTQDTTYDDATQSAHGLMSAEDKTVLDNVPTTYVKKEGDTVTGAINSLLGANSTDGVACVQFRGVMGKANDWWGVGGGATGEDSGFLEISTHDNGDEPIFVTQNNNHTGISRRAVLLDNRGNTIFPGSVTAEGGFIGDLKGQPTAPTPDISDNSTRIATTAYMNNVGQNLGTFNAMFFSQTSGTYTAPRTGIYRFTIKGGGGGGGGGKIGNTNVSLVGGGGGEGAEMIFYDRLIKNTSYAYVIGAGGAAGANASSNDDITPGASGGNTSIVTNGNTFSASGGGGGYKATSSQLGGAGGSTFDSTGTVYKIPGNPGEPGWTGSGGQGGNGGGSGGARSSTRATQHGVFGGGGMGASFNASVSAGHGGDGYILIEYAY